MLVVLDRLGGVLGHAAPESGPDLRSAANGRTARLARRCRWTKAWETWKARNCVSALPPARPSPPATTAIACGSVNCAHDSLNPLAGLSPLTGMWLNCIFGGKGVGMINLLLYLIVGVFIAGLMVGRTPEYLGKKVEAREMKLAMLALLVHPILILMSTGLFAATDWGIKSTNNPGAHGLSEIVYEFSSASANNGSEFGGLNTAWGPNDNPARPPTAGRGTSPRAW